MDRIHVGAGFSFVTAERVALAVLEYSRTLSERGMFQTLDVPIRREDGGRGRVSILLGPTVALVCESVEPAMQWVDEDDWTSMLEQETADLRRLSPAEALDLYGRDPAIRDSENQI